MCSNTITEDGANAAGSGGAAVARHPAVAVTAGEVREVIGQPGAEPGRGHVVLRAQPLLGPNTSLPEQVVPGDPAHAEADGADLALTRSLLPDDFLRRAERDAALGSGPV